LTSQFSSGRSIPGPVVDEVIASDVPESSTPSVVPVDVPAVAVLSVPSLVPVSVPGPVCVADVSVPLDVPLALIVPSPMLVVGVPIVAVPVPVVGSTPVIDVVDMLAPTVVVPSSPHATSASAKPQTTAGQMYVELAISATVFPPLTEDKPSSTRAQPRTHCGQTTLLICPPAMSL
jgi:hypothetical protein